MNPLKRLKNVIQKSGSLLEDYAKNYIAVFPQAKQVVLKPNAVLLLCDQAVSRVEQLTDLVPDTYEGLIATIEHGKIKAKIHFSPEKLCIKGDVVEGQIRLLNKPEVKSDSMAYNVLIAGWKIFLGGNLPNHLLPQGVRIDGDQVYYTLPKTQLKVLDALFQKTQSSLALNLELKESELKIDSAVEMNWSEINIQSLLNIFNDRKGES
ncbi:hypothetical protein [Spirulina subsalsa]|uniref:hypothetical protein n=1 Tax=Spirulina subsalsa TaxID=54311 RepID=UPI000367FCB9|nr:hypothetical protein [Spirulina subsalsa]